MNRPLLIALTALALLPATAGADSGGTRSPLFAPDPATGAAPSPAFIQSPAGQPKPARLVSPAARFRFGARELQVRVSAKVSRQLRGIVSLGCGGSRPSGPFYAAVRGRWVKNARRITVNLERPFDLQVEFCQIVRGRRPVALAKSGPAR